MPIFESTDGSHKESSVQSNVAAFFEDAYADHKVAGATMAVGMLAMTKGKSGAGLLAAELAAGGATKGAVAVAEGAAAKSASVVVEGAAELATKAIASPGHMNRLLTRGLVDVDVASAHRMKSLMDMGLPRGMDTVTTTKLAEGVLKNDAAATASVMDDIFNGTSYSAMRNRFGG